MLNEYVYCPRLAYMMWVQGEFAASADTVEGSIRHRRVDRPAGRMPPAMPKPKAAQAAEEEPPRIHVRSVALGSETLGITAKIDLVEGRDGFVVPVDYKKGKRPHVPSGAYAPERVQVCAQGLLLREHGYACEEGVLYFIASKERVPVRLDDELIGQTMDAIEALQRIADGEGLPEPLEESPKCPRCSLLGICLPEEVRFLNRAGDGVRPIFPSAETGLPLYVQSPHAYLRKSGERIVVEEKKVKVADAKLKDVSQVVVHGNTGLTTPLMHELMRREIPVTFLSYGGWFMGHLVGSGHKNVETRTAQYRASFDPESCLRLARRWVAAKIANGRTLMRRNWKGDDPVPPELLVEMRGDMNAAVRAKSLESLLGAEGNAARRYFARFSRMFRAVGEDAPAFDFNGRNRRPPRDPVNAMLSFAYAMLTREWVVALSAVGLDPYRGFFHQPRFGRPALALDMMEPFRPLVADSAVITAVNNGEVRASDFLVTPVGCTIRPEGRKRFIAVFERGMQREVTHPIFRYRLSYRRLFEVQARLLTRFLTGDIPRYPNFVTR
jgi:CRISPR-associated protein Cas1